MSHSITPQLLVIVETSPPLTFLVDRCDSSLTVSKLVEKVAKKTGLPLVSGSFFVLCGINILQPDRNISDKEMCVRIKLRGALMGGAPPDVEER